ncbi:uncharacterized protein CDAR_365271 [Caerostris darwini]|uniref:VWFC domain-containing protein n=1 Tax=Caerostris darwini TaxID=1538125 RepID=A0AAV4U8J6_9ARAC|nr:uncharacterized protein CDAR_365271 [Caerostris darwini]
MQYSFLVVLAICAVASWTSTGARVIHKRAAFYIANDTMCIVDGEVYRNGDPVPTDDECERCTCRPPGFSCVLRDCDIKPGCKAVRRSGECCPDYVCGCVHNNRVYEDGEIIKDLQNACYTCRCHGSSISCTFADCLFRGDCPPEYVPGECCPRYDHCPPLSTTSSSTIFTTPSTTQSSFVQQKEQIFINLTTQHLEKFTAQDTTFTIVEILPSSTTTTTTKAYTEEITTPTDVTVKFTLTDGRVSSIEDFDIATLTTVLPVQTTTYKDTTKYVIPNETFGELTTTTQASSSTTFEEESISKIQELTEAKETATESIFTSSIDIITEDIKVSITTATPENLSESSFNEKITEVSTSTEYLDESSETEIDKESTSLDHNIGITSDEEVAEQNKTSTEGDASSSTVSNESTHIFDGEELQPTEDVEVSQGELHSSTTYNDNESADNSEEIHKFPIVTFSTTQSTNEETSSFAGSLHNVSTISALNESTIHSQTEQYADQEHEASTEFPELNSVITEIFDGEETLSTDEKNKLFTTTNVPASSHQTLSTETLSEIFSFSNTTDSHTSTSNLPAENTNRTFDVLELTESHLITNTNDEINDFSTKQSTENFEISYTSLSNSPTTGTVNENDALSSETLQESFFSTSPEPLNIAKQQFTTHAEKTESSEEIEITEHTDSIEFETSDEKEILFQNKSAEDFPPVLIVLQNTPGPVIETTSHQSVFYTSTASDVSEIKFSETSQNGSSHDILEENDDNNLQTENYSSSINALDSEVSTFEEHIDSFQFASNESTVKTYYPSTSTVFYPENNDTDFISSVEILSSVPNTNEISTLHDTLLTHETTTVLSVDFTPETISDLLPEGSKFDYKTNTSENKIVPESSNEISENKNDMTNKIFELTTEISYQESSMSNSHTSFDHSTITAIADSDQSKDYSNTQNVFITTTNSQEDTNKNLIVDTADEDDETELNVTENLNSTVYDEIVNETVTLMKQTESILESETLQTNFDTIIYIEQTTKSEDLNKVSEDMNSSEALTTVPVTEHSTELSDSSNDYFNKNYNTENLLDNTVNGLDIESIISDDTVLSHSPEEGNNIETVSQFTTFGIGEENKITTSTIPEFVTKDEVSTINTEILHRASTTLQHRDEIAITTTEPIYISFDSNEDETKEKLIEKDVNVPVNTINNDYENLDSETIINNPSNDYPAVPIFGQELNDTSFSTTIISNFSELSTFDNHINTSTDAESFEPEFSTNLSDHYTTKFSNDNEPSTLAVEEDMLHPVLVNNFTQLSDIEKNPSTPIDEFKFGSDSKPIIYQTNSSTLSSIEEFTSAENNSNIEDSELLSTDEEDINTANNFNITSEQDSFSLINTPENTENSFITEEIQSKENLSTATSVNDENIPINLEYTENQNLDLNILHQSTKHNVHISTTEEIPTQNKDKITSGDDYNKDHLNGDVYSSTIFNAGDFTTTNFQNIETNASSQLMDEITSSTEIPENKLNYSKEETLPSKFEIGENFTSNSDIFINNTISPQETTDDYSVEEVLDGEELSSSDYANQIENNLTEVIYLDISNQSNAIENFDNSEILVSNTTILNNEPSFSTTFTSESSNSLENSNTDGIFTPTNEAYNILETNEQITSEQNNEKVESHETFKLDFVTHNTNVYSENNANESKEENSTVDGNIFGIAMHEYDNDSESHNTSRLTDPSTSIENTEVIYNDQTNEYHDLEFDSEEETTENFNINITNPSVSYRVETARNLDDSTTEHLSIANESNAAVHSDGLNSANVLTDNYFNINKENINLSEDTSIHSNPKNVFKHDESLFNNLGDHFNADNLYSAFAIPSDTNINAISESELKYSNYTEKSQINESQKEEDFTEHISSSTANSSTNTEIDFDSKTTTQTSGTHALNNDTKIQKPLNEENLDEKENDPVQTELDKASTEHIHVKTFDSSNILLTIPNETSEKHHLQMQYEDSETADGPEKGGEWFEPSLSSPNITDSENPDSSVSNETTKLDTKPDHSSTLSSIMKQNGPEKGGEIFEPTLPNLFPSNSNQSGPEKGGDFFEPTIQNPFPLNVNTVEKAGDGQIPSETVQNDTKTTAKIINIATTIPAYVFSTAQEITKINSETIMTSTNSENESSNEDTNINDNPENNIRTKINTEVSATEETPSLSPVIKYLHETTISSEDSQTNKPVKFENNIPLSVNSEKSKLENDNLEKDSELNSATQEKSQSNSLTKEKIKLLQPYSLMDVISNVFKAPGYDSEVHSSFLKEQVDYSDDEKTMTIVKRSADGSFKNVEFENGTSNNHNKTDKSQKESHILQTKKTVYNNDPSSIKVTNMRPRDPPPAKVTSSFIFVVSPNDNNAASTKSSVSVGSAEEIEFSDNNHFLNETQ